jgi:hypothetical protein
MRDRMSVEEFREHLRQIKRNHSKGVPVMPQPKSTGKSKPDLSLEGEFAFQLESLSHLPLPHRQVIFAPARKWAWDFAWPRERLAIEIDGGGWAGRHLRPAGYIQGCRKCNVGALLGWVVVRGTRDMVRSGELLAVVEHYLRNAGCGRVEVVPDRILLAGLKAARKPSGARKAKSKAKRKAVRG